MFRDLRAEGGPHVRGHHGVHVRRAPQGRGVRVRLPHRREPVFNRRARSRRAQTRRRRRASPARGAYRGGGRPRGGHETQTRRARDTGADVRGDERQRVGYRQQSVTRGRSFKTARERRREAHRDDALVRLVRAPAPGHRRRRLAPRERARHTPPGGGRLEQGRGRRAQRVQHLHPHHAGPEPGAGGEAHRAHLRRRQRAVQTMGGDDARIAGVRKDETRSRRRLVPRARKSDSRHSKKSRGGDGGDALDAEAVRAEARGNLRAGSGHDPRQPVRRVARAGAGDGRRRLVGGGGLDVPGDRRARGRGERVLHRQLHRLRVEEPENALRAEDWKERVEAFDARTTFCD
mmetsp:Transcript_5830/g.24690  ORF Transcript_5830/g.24690 Transcript_5830/m.24690 type:complete len:347 (+) Transcript_5830:816-1856(+)